jgi:predicted enzyme related to lactoylglutathione lyase
MGARESYPPGTFSWADLGTTDPAGARDFYARLLGWQAVEVPVGGERFRLEGADVAGLHQAAEGEPPRWTSFVTVEDADAVVARARELGGEVVTEPSDLPEAGRTALVRDPTGAVVRLWQPAGQAGAARVNDPGCLVWNELASPDPERAREFYAALLGWTAEADETGYATIRRDGEPNGGIRPLQEDEAPQWLVYFTVTSVDAAADTVREAGGRVLAGPMAVTMGRIAVVADPQGAVLALFEGQVDP